MINLNSTNELIQLVTSSAISTMVTTDYIDITSSGTSIPSGIADQIITTASTTTIIGSPAASTQRKIYGIRIYNNGGTTQTVTIQRYNGTTAFILFTCANLQPGFSLIYDDVAGWNLFTNQGSPVSGGSSVFGTANEITATTGGGGVTLSIPSTFIAPGTISGSQFISTVSTGTAPFTVTSTTQVANLNVATAGVATNIAGGAAGSLVYQTAANTTSELVLGTTNYVLTAGASAPQYVAQSTLSVGTATTATTATNLSGTTVGSLPYQSASATTSYLADVATGSVLVSGGSGVAPAWSTTPTFIGTNISGTAASLTVGSSNNTLVTTSSANVAFPITLNPSTSTGQQSLLMTSNLTYNPTTNALVTTGSVSSGTFISTVSTGTAPFTVTSTTQVANLNVATAGVATNIAGGAAGSLVYQTAANTTTTLGIGLAGYYLTVNGGATAPQWTALPSTVSTFSAGTTGFTPSTATSGAVTLAGTLGLSNGGTNASLTATAGGIVYSTSSAFALSAVGSTGNVLISGGTSAPTWTGALTINLSGNATISTPSSGNALTLNATSSTAALNLATGLLYIGGSAGTAGQVLTSGGTSAVPTWSSPSGTPGGSTHQLQYNNGGAFGGIGLGTAGQVLISDGSSGAPAFGSVTSTGGTIIVTSSAGSINVDTNGAALGSIANGVTQIVQTDPLPFEHISNTTTYSITAQQLLGLAGVKQAANALAVAQVLASGGGSFPPSGTTISLGGSSVTAIDGVSLVAGQVIWLTGQTSTSPGALSQNGPWVVGSPWVRPQWYYTGNTSQAFNGVTVQVLAGTTYGGTWWTMSTPAIGTTVTIDTTSTAFTQLAGSGGGGGVTSITGTSNQIAASASTGAVTLSMPSTVIMPGSFAVSSTTGITASGTVGFTTAATIDSTNFQVVQANSVSTYTFGGTCSPQDNMLIIVESHRASGTMQGAPTSITYNGIALTMLGNVDQGTIRSQSIWYLANPPTGYAYSCVVTYITSTFTQSGSIAFIPISGASGSFGTYTSNSNTSSTSATVTPTGAGSNDLYIGGIQVGTATITEPGGNQVLLNTGSFNSDTYNYDYILGSHTGSFSWTLSTADPWLTQGIAVLGLGSSSNGTALTSDYNVVSTVPSGSCVVLPTPSAGREVTVVNSGANPLNVFPPASNVIIDSLGVGVPVTIPVGGNYTIIGSSPTQMWSIDKTTNQLIASGLPGTVNVQTFTSAGNWLKPLIGTPALVRVICIGGGGGGGSGAQIAALAAASGGAGGGGAATSDYTFQASALSNVVAVTVGTGGTGGAATSATGSGNPGTVGGTSSFGTYIKAGGGGGGGPGSAAAASGGGGGGTWGGTGSTGTTTGGLPGGGGDGGGANGATGNTAAGNGYVGNGAGGGGSSAAGATGGNGGNPVGFSPGGTGGSGGGGLSAAAAFSGGLGNPNMLETSYVTAGALGTTGSAGGSPINPTTPWAVGSGGAGGGAGSAGAGGAGGAGGVGGGGGGGGASVGAASGAGGAGGNGIVAVFTYF